MDNKKEKLRTPHILLATILAICLLLGLAGCGGGDGAGESGDVASRTGNQSKSVNDVLQEGMAAADGTESMGVLGSEPPAGGAFTPKGTDYKYIDIDLTELSANMVFSEVSGMMMDPASYVGKVIKMDGIASCFYDENQGKYYFACIVQDATECCAQGIEFELKDTYTYPDDFPADGEQITVVGVFTVYEEDGFNYCTLLDADRLQ